MRRPLIFYHLWPHEGWQGVHREFMEPLVGSGLLEAADFLRIGWAAPADWLDKREVLDGLPLDRTLVRPLRHGMNEWPTLEMLHDACRGAPPDTPVLYLHCRGARYRPDEIEFKPVKDHNSLMRYFLVEKWREAVAWLEQGYDVAACQIQEEPGLHASGNMWWARAGGIATLEAPMAVEARIPKQDFM